MRDSEISSDTVNEMDMGNDDYGSFNRTRSILRRDLGCIMLESDNSHSVWNCLTYNDVMKTGWDNDDNNLCNKNWNESDMTSTNSGTLLTSYAPNDIELEEEVELVGENITSTDSYYKDRNSICDNGVYYDTHITCSTDDNVKDDCITSYRNYIPQYLYRNDHQDGNDLICNKNNYYTSNINNTNSFLNNHQILYDFNNTKSNIIKISNTNTTTTTSASSNSDIIQSNAKPIIVTVHSNWDDNQHFANTIPVKQYDKVELIARCDDWLYVKTINNPKFGWIPESTLVENELISRGLYNKPKLNS